MDLVFTTFIAVIFVLAVYWLWQQGNKGFDVFEKRGIPYLKPVPFLGSQLPVIMRKVTVTDFVKNAFNKFPETKITGLFNGKTPVYMFKDAELLKQIGVRDFEYFMDHNKIFKVDTDPLFANSLFVLSGEKWRDMRATLSPMFTGSRMRQMFDLLSEVGVRMGEHFKTVAPEDRVVEMRDVFGRFAVDVIASTIFGVQVDSLKNRDNEFSNKALHLLDFNKISTTIKMLISVAMPNFAKRIGFKIITETKFFEDLIRETEKVRNEQEIVRPDMINLMMQLKKGELQHDETSEDHGFATVHETDLGKASNRKWTDDELMAQAFIFFFAGFDSVANTASFTAYELAINPDIQARLRDEVDAVVSELDGKNLTYEALQKMKYMDMVVSEGLRYWPSADTVDRVCVKDYKMKNDKGEEIIVEKGSTVWIPIVALHYSEKYYENPLKFDPERFSDENKHKINRGAYLPFGLGPRNCIGSRFALMELKAALFYLLKDFTINVHEKTQIPLKLKVGLSKASERGIWLQLEPRQK